MGCIVQVPWARSIVFSSRWFRQHNLCPFGRKGSSSAKARPLPAPSLSQSLPICTPFHETTNANPWQEESMPQAGRGEGKGTVADQAPAYSWKLWESRVGFGERTQCDCGNKPSPTPSGRRASNRHGLVSPAAPQVTFSPRPNDRWPFNNFHSDRSRAHQAVEKGRARKMPAPGLKQG